MRKKMEKEEELVLQGVVELKKEREREKKDKMIRERKKKIGDTSHG